MKVTDTLIGFALELVIELTTGALAVPRGFGKGDGNTLSIAFSRLETKNAVIRG